MNGRYVSRPKAMLFRAEFDANTSMTAGEVVVVDERPVDTGLLDASGTPLYRVRATVPFGFVPAKSRG